MIDYHLYNEEDMIKKYTDILKLININNVDDFKNFSATYGDAKTEALLKEISAILQSSVIEIDRVGRLYDDKFVVILPEKNKRQSAHVADEIRKQIEDN